MKKLGREADKLEAINLFSLLRDDAGSSLFDPKNRSTFLEQVDSGLGKALDSASTLHGIRAQAMFEGMVANLGAVRFIKQEDAGDCYFDGDDLGLPDFRIVTKSNLSFLIETKSHFHKNAMKAYRIRQADLDGLRRYASLCATPLRIAIYWTQWNLWTLNQPESFTPRGRYAELPFHQAMKLSEMATLGDFTIGTKYPLSLTILADANKERSIDAAGKALIYGGDLEVRCGQDLIVDTVERNIVLYLMMYGKWEYDGGRVELDSSGLPMALVHTSSPEEPSNPGEEFEMVGSLSSLYCSLYNSLTLRDGIVERLRVKDPASLAPIIPLKFEKKSLSLWRFVMQPNPGAQEDS